MLRPLCFGLVLITKCLGETLYNGQPEAPVLLPNHYCKNSTDWVCAHPSKCLWADKAIKRGERPHICSFQGKTPIICCPIGEVKGEEKEVKEETTVPPRVVPSHRGIYKEKCQEYAKFVFEEEDSPILGLGTMKRDKCTIDSQTLVVGGEKAKPREFPHMALIGYGQELSTVSWLCGGSLISEDFVLSAAHCSYPSNKNPATWVKLGELDENTNTDDARPIIKEIIQIIDHPKYNKENLYHDITLFRLENKVQLSPYIRPICLPDKRALPSTAIATGWGHTTFGGRRSSDLMKALLKFTDHQNCSETYLGKTPKLPSGIKHRLQICAGSPDKDTCQGDSGGPLQIVLLEPYCSYMVIGITSFGIGCASGFPGVYTKVQNYVKWIEDNVWGPGLVPGSGTELYEDYGNIEKYQRGGWK